MATGGQRAARTAPGPLLRVIHAWRVLGREQRIAALAALSLWVTMFLPWYSEAPAGAVKKGETVVSSSLTAWGAFSWVEAAVLLVSVGVLALLFARGERRAFHLPGGDGPLITLAGGWVALLVIYRLFDKNSEKVAGLVITPGQRLGHLPGAVRRDLAGLHRRRDPPRAPRRAAARRRSDRPHAGASARASGASRRRTVAVGAGAARRVRRRSARRRARPRASTAA